MIKVSERAKDVLLHWKQSAPFADEEAQTRHDEKRRGVLPVHRISATPMTPRKNSPPQCSRTSGLCIQLTAVLCITRIRNATPATGSSAAP